MHSIGHMFKSSICPGSNEIHERFSRVFHVNDKCLFCQHNRETALHIKEERWTNIHFSYFSLAHHYHTFVIKPHVHDQLRSPESHIYFMLYPKLRTDAAAFKHQVPLIICLVIAKQLHCYYPQMVE